MKRNSVIIGLGGSGRHVVLQVRKKFAEKGMVEDGHFGPKTLQYFCLDTTNEPDEEFPEHIRLREAGEVPELLTLTISPENFLEYRDGACVKFPHIKQWLPKAALKAEKCPQSGAGQKRALGRLIFFDNMTKPGGIYQKVDALLNKIRSIEAEVKQKEEISPEIDVYLVYSTAGGTGAGMFMDMSILLRKVAQNKRMTLKIMHYAFLPDVFTETVSDKNRDSIQANGYACLVDMELMSNPDRSKSGLSFPTIPSETSGSLYQWHHQFQGTPEVWDLKSVDRPWNSINLISRRNDQSDKEIKGMVAEGIFLNFEESPLGQKIRNLQSNEGAQNPQPYSSPVQTPSGDIIFNRQLQTVYNTFGLAFIRFDRSVFRQKAAVYLANHFIEQHLLRPNALNEQKVGEIVQGALGKEGDTGTYFKKEGTGPLSPGAIVQSINSEQTVRIEEEFKKFNGNALEWRNKYFDVLDRLTRDISGQLQKRQLEFHEKAAVPALANLFSESIASHGLKGAEAVFSEAHKHFRSIERKLKEILGNYPAEIPEPAFSRLEDAEGLALSGFRAEAVKIVTSQLREQCAELAKMRVTKEILPLAIDEVTKILALIGSPTEKNSYLWSASQFENVLSNTVKANKAKAENIVYRKSPDETYSVDLDFDMSLDDILEHSWEIIRGHSGVANPAEMNYGNANLNNFYTNEISGKLIDGLWNNILGERKENEEVRIGGLVTNLWPVSGRRVGPLSDQAILERVQEKLNIITTRILRGFAENLTINEILCNKFTSQDQEKLAKELSNKAGLLIEKTQSAIVLNQAHHARPENFLGIFPDTKQFSRKIISNIRRVDEDLNVTDMASDNIFIYRHLTHIPACYYSRLDDLRKSYDRYPSKPLAHFDYAYFKNSIIDICVVSENLAKSIEANAAKILYSVIMNVITLSDQGLTFLNNGIPHYLGFDLYGVIESLSQKQILVLKLNEDFNKKMREYQADKTKSVRLVNALRLLRVKITDALEMSTEENREKLEEYPLFKLVNNTMLAEAMKWTNYETLELPERTAADDLWNQYMSNPGNTAALEENRKRFTDLVTPWFDIFSDDLPIPVVKVK